MDSQVQASFIPKKPLDNGSMRRGGGGIGNLFFLIAFLIFIASLVAAGAVFAYEQYLNTTIASEGNSLQQAQGAFDLSVIQNLERVDSRLIQANALLQKHVASSAIFNFLSAQTLQNVQFNSFDYVLNDDGSAAITLDGQADSFATMALQSDQFGTSTNKVLSNVVFSDIKVGPGGTITFSVKATVAASLINYEKNLTTVSAQQTTLPANPLQSGTTTTTTTTSH